ncbi:MAG TPA: DUF2486 family protein [Paraburkholderia sp.]|nr:DUF2486 family protein [Paraburkholderia sp.]
MSDPNDDSIPVLHEILVPGPITQARRESADAGTSATQPASEIDALRREPVFAPQPGATPEPVLAPEPRQAAPAAPPAGAAHTPEAAHATRHPKAHPHAESAAVAQASRVREHDHEPAHVPSSGVFDRTEPLTPVEAGAIVPPDVGHQATLHDETQLDADVIAGRLQERLQQRLAGFLTGEGRDIIEARCRAALQDHTARLVSEITREVAQALETGMTGWVREAVEEEIARRAGRG